MPQPPPIFLTILRKGDTNIIDLAEVGALIPRSETRVDDAFLREVSAEVERVALPGYGREENLAVVHNLQRVGELIFSHLFTEAARQRLRTAQPCVLYLRLDESLIQAPWELSYDGEQFLALKFRLGRQVITSAPLPERGTTHREPGALRVLLIADPTETLPQARQEAERLCELLGGIRGVEVTLLGGSEVRKAPLLMALQAHDIVHFAGHSQYDVETPSHSGWVLHEGILTAGELSKLSRPPLLVFSNSCQAGVTAEWKRGYRYEGQAFGIGSAFLLAGVQNYVGTFWVVQDEESTLFATAFYRSLTAGQSIGEALFQARQSSIAQRGWAGLTWASYMLYGDPAFTLLPTTRDHPLSGVSAATQPRSVGVMQRKLAAILSADVKGYSRLMGEDEVATIRTLTIYREVMATLISQHHGRVVDAPGDNLLAEFASAVDAVQCAVEIQHELKGKNVDLPDSRKMEFRIGINVGDVIVEGERLYGDGVNIAARLEGLADAGGICLSGTVYDQVGNKLALRYEYVGEQEVKNITKPVRVYRIAAEIPSPLGGEGQGEGNGKESERRNAKVENKGGYALRLRTVLVAAGLLIVAGVVTLLFRSPLSPQPSTLVTPGALPLPDKPSLVVLPFTNMSGDPAQEYFSDGITEDLTTSLAKVSALIIIARNSAFTYKGKPVDVKTVSRELGVRYVLEGSVRKADGRVRITAQLVDGSSATHVWAESYDRELKDIFAVQDEVRQKIVFALQIKLTLEEQERFRRAPTNNLEAYDFFLRGLESHYRNTKETNVQARQLFEKALTLDPQYAGGYAMLGWTYWERWLFHWSQNPQQDLEQAFALAQRARALDDSVPDAHQLLSWVYLQKNQPEQALAEAERALALDPNYVDNYQTLAKVLIGVGRPQEAVGMAEKAVRLDPRGPNAVGCLLVLGAAYLSTGRVEEAITTQKQALMLDPNAHFAYTDLAFSYAFAWGWQLSQDPQMLEQALAAAQKAVAWNDSFPWAHTALGVVYLLQKQHDQARAEAERAIALDPDLAGGYSLLAGILNVTGKPEEALGAAEKAVRLGSPDLGHLFELGHAYCLSGRYEEAIATLKKLLTHYPNQLPVHLILATAYSESGREAEARAAAAEVLRISPKFSLEVHKQRAPIKDPAVLERQVAALRKAGLK